MKLVKINDIWTLQTSWNEEDVQCMAEQMYKTYLEPDMVKEVLEDIMAGFDANYGINWEVIEASIENVMRDYEPSLEVLMQWLKTNVSYTKQGTLRNISWLRNAVQNHYLKEFVEPLRQEYMGINRDTATTLGQPCREVRVMVNGLFGELEVEYQIGSNNEVILGSCKTVVEGACPTLQPYIEPLVLASYDEQEFLKIL